MGKNEIEESEWPSEAHRIAYSPTEEIEEEFGLNGETPYVQDFAKLYCNHGDPRKMVKKGDILCASFNGLYNQEVGIDVKKNGDNVADIMERVLGYSPKGRVRIVSKKTKSDKYFAG